MILRLSSACFNPSKDKKNKQNDGDDMSNFRRSQSKVFYASDVWDPGVSEEPSHPHHIHTQHSSCPQMILNDIIEEDEIEEEEEDDLTSSPSGSGSFRIIPRGSSSRSSQESSSSTGDIRVSYAGKSQDSGFSDSGESAENVSAPRSGVRFADEAEGAKGLLHQRRHVSKVYFYSREDGEESDEEDDVEETGGSTPQLLSPPVSPPPAAYAGQTTSNNEELLLDCDILDSFLEHKPLVLPSASTQTSSSQSRPSGSSHSGIPVLYIGTSSLGRRSETLRRSGAESPAKPPALFPKTNGSLYDHRRGTGGSLYHPHGIITVPDAKSSSSEGRPKSGIATTTTHSQRPEARPDPVEHWLKELSSVQEAECTIMLQSKPLSPGIGHSSSSSSGISQVIHRPLSRQQQTLPPSQKASSGLQENSSNSSSSFWTGTSKETIRAIQARAHSISALFAKLCRQLEQKGVWKLSPLVTGLAHQIDLFLAEYNAYNTIQLSLPGLKSKSSSPPWEASSLSEGILHQQRILRQTCESLKLAVSRSSQQGGVQSIVDVIKVLGPSFNKLIELMLSKEILSSLDRIQLMGDSGTTPTDLVLKRSIDAVIGLALEGNHLCRLIAKHGGVRSLLEICSNPSLRHKSSRVSAFRALGTVCCVLEGILELEEAGGITILSSALNDPESTEDEKSEAAGLLAQVTSPFIENNSSIDGLRTHLDHLVQSLTDLSSVTKSDETFLLASAALANLTFMEPIVVDAMKTHSTSSVLIRWIQESPREVSIYIMDQVAAVLANMANSEPCRTELSQQGAIPILLEFLGASPPEEPLSSEDYAQMAATQRVQQKSAIAISRMCSHPGSVEEVLRLNGLKRLIELVKDESARVQSDGVLVACLATVRKISSVLNDVSVFRSLDASELVEPRLLDSFLIFSNRNESFV